MTIQPPRPQSYWFVWAWPSIQWDVAMAMIGTVYPRGIV